MSTLVLLVAFGAGAFGAAYFSTSTVSAVTTVVPAPAPVLDRIADCESGTGKSGSGSQFRSNGEVVTNTNTNGSVDVGKYQINMNAGHIKEMAKLGFNPLTEEGNKAYAEYIYQNHGTGDWSSSSHCWYK